jgi:NAD(P)-dependent dehydrogenase (short-subunit alcohol dehydrogenase family)
MGNRRASSPTARRRIDLAAERGQVGRVAIVTGGASGIGRALSAALVARGATVVVADIDGYGAERVAGELRDRGHGTATAEPVDVADRRAITDLIETTYREHGRLDLLFNNAGLGVGGEPEELTDAHWDTALDVNVRGVINGCQAAYPLLLERGSGHIVNTASLAGLIPAPGTMTAYAMSKHAVVGLSLGLRAAATDTGVGIHVVCPGLVETPILDKNDIPGLPTPPSAAGVDIREFFRDLGVRSIYPPDRLATDILAGIARDRAIIVAPAPARTAWRIARLSPQLALRSASAGTRRARARRRERHVRSAGGADRPQHPTRSERSEGTTQEGTVCGVR